MNIRILPKLIIILGTLGVISVGMNFFYLGSIAVTVTLVGLTSLFVGLHIMIISQQKKVEGTYSGDKIIGILVMVIGIVLIGSMIVKMLLAR